MSGAKEIPVQELNVSQLSQLSQQLEQVYFRLNTDTVSGGHTKNRPHDRTRRSVNIKQY